MSERVIAGGLKVAHTSGRLSFAYPNGSGLCFERRAHRAASLLLFAGAAVKVDVSLQPAATVLNLDQAAREEGVDPNRWRTAVLQELRPWWPDLQWCEPQPQLLTAAVGAITHPILAHVYKAGRAPLGEVPRWATHLLRSENPQSAAETLAPNATRRLVKALAESLLAGEEGGPTNLGPLAVATVGRSLCTGDELANLLAVPNTTPTDRLPSVDELETAHDALSLYPASRRAGLLDDTARHHDVRELAEVGKLLLWASDKVERPLPLRLGDLKERCRRHVPVLADRPATAALPDTTEPSGTPPAAPADSQAGAPILRPRTRPPATRPARPTVAPPAAAVEPAEPPLWRGRAAALGAPRVNVVGRTPNCWPVPAALLPVHQLRHEGLSYSVPTSRSELATWGAVLRNCLGDFGRAAATQTSWLIGIEHDDRLIGCVEVDPVERRVRQALGPRNQPLPEHVHRITIALLQRKGIIR